MFMGWKKNKSEGEMRLFFFGTVNADTRSAKLEDLFHVSCKLHSVPAEGGIHHVK